MSTEFFDRYVTLRDGTVVSVYTTPNSHAPGAPKGGMAFRAFCRWARLPNDAEGHWRCLGFDHSIQPTDLEQVDAEEFNRLYPVTYPKVITDHD